jgi:hypothetical protein
MSRHVLASCEVFAAVLVADAVGAGAQVRSPAPGNQLGPESVTSERGWLRVGAVQSAYGCHPDGQADVKERI